MDPEVLTLAARFGEVISLQRLNRHKVFNYSDIYFVDYRDCPPLVIKHFPETDERGEDLLRRERWAYQVLQADCAPALVEMGSRTISVERLKAPPAPGALMQLPELMARLHRQFSLLPQSNDTNFHLNYFGDISTYLEPIMLHITAVPLGAGCRSEVLAGCAHLLNSSDHLCHGDLAFSNVGSRLEELRLFDFECVSRLPPEFDLSALFDFEYALTGPQVHTLLRNYYQHNSIERVFSEVDLLWSLVFNSLRRFKFNLNVDGARARFYEQRFIDAAGVLGLIERTSAMGIDTPLQTFLQIARASPLTR